jgi:selenocysteine lyase/cysteine desulfurase
MNEQTMIPSQRHLFDIPEDIAYFNCAYYSPLLNESKRRLMEGVAAKSHPWERTAHHFFDRAETIRSLASNLFGGDPDGYAIIPSVSYGVSTAARSIEPQLNKGDRVLLIDEEFPSNVLIWQRIAAERSIEIVTVPTPEDGNWTDAITAKIDGTIKVVTLSSCHWTNGAFINLEEVRKACDVSGTVLIVDATQTLGAMPFDMGKVRPDFLVVAGYKWLLCPYGFSLIYVAEKWRGSRPLEESWQARQNAEDFTSLANYSDNYMPGARRFDVGEKGTDTLLPGAIAALEQLKEWGIPSIAASLLATNNKIADHLNRLGFQLPNDSQRCPHLLGAIIPAHYTGNLVAELRKSNIYISQRGNSVRFAPHLYINESDLSRLFDGINHTLFFSK